MSTRLEVIKRLREVSGGGLMDCKAALEACLWHEDLALTWLRTKGIAVAYSDPEMYPHRRAEQAAKRRGPNTSV